MPSGQSLSANPQFAQAIVYYNQGLSSLPPLKNDAGRFQKVGLQPGEAVDVVMTFTALDFGQPADVQVLDGGSVGAPTIPKLQPSIPPTPTPFPIAASGPPIETSIPCGDNVPCISPTPIVPVVVTEVQNLANTATTQLQELTDSGRTIPVSLTGQLAFSFRPGDGPGLHRVSIIVNGNQYILQFWQQDPNHPNSNLVKAY